MSFEPKSLKKPGFTPISYGGLLTLSAAMRDFMDKVARVASSDAAILVRGDTGTGKELVARFIHQQSVRKDAPFNVINCASLTPEMMASELFGHRRGAFTGAVNDRKGLLELTQGGTLFLDEIAEMPMEIQARLLRVLQDGRYTPMGSSDLLYSDIRIVSATHTSLRHLVAEKRFREDLMYRVRVIPLFLPRLIERGDDLAMLIWHFIEHFNNKSNRRITRVETRAWQALLTYDWPGNIRELANIVEYAHVVGTGETLKYRDLNPDIQENSQKGAGHKADLNDHPVASSILKFMANGSYSGKDLRTNFLKSPFGWIVKFMVVSVPNCVTLLICI